MRTRAALIAAVLGAVSLLPLAPDGIAHTGASFCEGTFDHSGGHDSHEDPMCETGFQGFPVGVIGVFSAVGDDAHPGLEGPAEIHVEAFGVTATGSRYKFVECEVKGTGVESCEAENAGPGSLTLPEPIPQEIVRIECLAHSHAKVLSGTESVGRFGCYSTAEAEAALREDMGLPADEEPTGEEPPEEEPSGGSGGSLGSAITAVPQDTYAPPATVTGAGGGLTFVNADLGVQHDVVALEATRPDGSAPWCGEYDAGACPLFWSELVAGGLGVATPVLGVEDAEPGTYEFFCSIHPRMVGTLEVIG